MKVRKELVIAVVLGVLLCSILVSAMRLPNAQASNPQVSLGYNVWALATDGTYIYAASSSTSGGYNGMLYALTASLGTAGSVTLGTWATSGNNYDIGETPTQMLYYNGYLYLIDEDCVAQVQYSSGSFTQVANLGRSQLLMSSAYNYEDADAQEYNGYLYVVGASNAAAFGQYYVTLWAINLSNLAVTDKVTTIACSSSGQLISIVNGNLWVTFPSAGYMYEFSTSLSETGSFAFSETSVGSMVTDGTYIYSVSSSSSDYLWTFDAASGQSQNSINEGVICQAMYPQSMTYLSGYVFLAAYATNNVLSFSSPGGSLVASQSVSASDLDSLLLNNAGTELYVGSDDGFVTEVAVSSLTAPSPTPTPVPVNVNSFSDSFSSGTINSAVWTTVGTVSIETQRVVGSNYGCTCSYNGAGSNNYLQHSGMDTNSETFSTAFYFTSLTLPSSDNFYGVGIMETIGDVQNPYFSFEIQTAPSIAAHPGETIWGLSVWGGGSIMAGEPIDAGQWSLNPAVNTWYNITLVFSNVGSNVNYVFILINATQVYALNIGQWTTINDITGIRVGVMDLGGNGQWNFGTGVSMTEDFDAVNDPQPGSSSGGSGGTSTGGGGGGSTLPSPSPTSSTPTPEPTHLKLPNIWNILTSIWRKIPTLLQDLMTAFLVLMILLLFAAAANRRDKNKRTSHPRLRTISTFPLLFLC